MTDESRALSSPGAGEILRILREGPPRTKAELAELTGLARSSVAARIESLAAAGLVMPAGEAVSTGGRPPARIAFNPEAATVLVADLGATHATVAVTDLAARVRAARTLEVDIARGPDEVLSLVLAVAAELLADQPAPLIGVGVGLPGPVEHSTGRPRNPPIMPGWDGFDVPAAFQGAYDVPVLVDNDVNILALGERALRWPGVDDLVFVKVSTGIGAGVVSGGALQRGAQGSAGDMGHVHVPYSRDSPRDPADERDLEAVASGTAIAAALRERGLAAATSADAVALIAAGDPLAVGLARQAGRDVGEVLAMVVNLLNPSTIVIGGSVARAGEHLLAGVREVVYRRSIPLATVHLTIAPSQAGDLAGVLGAAIMVTQHVLAPVHIDARATSRRIIDPVTTA